MKRSEFVARAKELFLDEEMIMPWTDVAVRVAEEAGVEWEPEAPPLPGHMRESRYEAVSTSGDLWEVRTKLGSTIVTDISKEYAEWIAHVLNEATKEANRDED